MALLGLSAAALWKIAAGMFGAKLAVDLGLGLRGYGIQKQHIKAGLKGQELQAGIGRREERRMNQLITQLLAHTTKEKAEGRELDVLKMLVGGAQQQNMMLTALTQMQRPARTGYAAPSASLMSLLR